MKRLLAALMTVAVIAPRMVFADEPAQAEAAEAKTLKVLCVGNSFSLNATRYFPAIAKAGGKELKVVNASIGGCSIERHLRHAKLYAENPEDPQGRPYGPSGKLEYGTRSLQQMLESDTWDFVTIQQSSPLSFKPESFQPFGDELIAIIRAHAPQAEVVVHQTWAYREDHKFWGRDDLNTDIMYALIRKSYDTFAEGAKLRLIPSGDAMEAARRDPAWGSPISGDPPTVNDEKSLHTSDSYHASHKGQYLQGCVWYEFFFGESVIGNSMKPGNLSDEEVATLQRIAHEVVSEGKRPEPREK